MLQTRLTLTPVRKMVRQSLRTAGNATFVTKGVSSIEGMWQGSP